MAQQVSGTAFKIPRCPAPQPPAQTQPGPPQRGPWPKKSRRWPRGPSSSNLLPGSKMEEAILVIYTSSAPFLSLCQSVPSVQRAGPELAPTVPRPTKRKRDCSQTGAVPMLPVCLTSTVMCPKSIKLPPVPPGMLPWALKKNKKICTVKKHCENKTLCVTTGNSLFRGDRPHKHFTSAGLPHCAPCGVPCCSGTRGCPRW